MRYGIIIDAQKKCNYHFHKVKKMLNIIRQNYDSRKNGLFFKLQTAITYSFTQPSDNSRRIKEKKKVLYLLTVVWRSQAKE